MLQNKLSSPLIKTFFALGTINTIQIFDPLKEAVLDKAVERVAEIEYRLSAFHSESELSRIRANAGLGFQQVQEDTFRLIQKAVRFGGLSEGAFDVTIRPLVELWGINKKGDYVPSDSEIEAVHPLVNYQDIALDSQSKRVMLKNSGQALVLGGIAKGYAADEVKRILIENGIRSALINLGGNIVTIGKRPELDSKSNGHEWKIGIQNPLAPTGNYLGTITATNKTIVTSGSNERFFIKDGNRYHHILDPRTGKPAKSGLLSVTAVCTCSTDADALTTALFILGIEKGMPLLKKMKADAIFVMEDLTISVTTGLLNRFE